MGQVIKECCGREERACTCGVSNKPKTICPSCGADITAWESREAFGTPHTIDCRIFPDANLETAIRGVVKKPEGSLSSSDLEKVIVLIASGRNISDLSGLEHCVNLQELYLSDNNISNISALAELSNLQELFLADNNISDISPLARLTKLETLSLIANNISDISPLARLSKLRELNLRDNHISVISALAGLTSLKELDLEGNDISDISALAGMTNLKWLDVRSNNITDLNHLAAIRGKLPLDCYFYPNQNPCFKGETNG